MLNSVPNIVNDRINRLCSDENIFKEEKQAYEKALKSQGHKNLNFKYKTPESVEERENKMKIKAKNKQKARQILWFVPPYTRQIERGCTVGKRFFQILDSCFPKEHPLSKIINRNTVKQSYRTMANFGRIIKSLNKKVSDKYLLKLNQKADEETKMSKKGRGRPKYLVPKKCNCDKNHSCPLDKNCNRTDIV